MDRAARRRAARGNGKRIAGVWLSNAPWAPTGYGQQTAQVVPRIIADGHRIAIAANYGLEAASTTWEGIDVWPRGMDVYSQDIAGPYFRDWGKQHPGMTPVMFTLYDVHVFTSPQWDSINVVSWVPVDHLPVPPAVAAFCGKPNVHPIAMSRFGLEQLQRKDIEAHYAPHAIDTSVYQHADYVQQENGKRITGRELMSLSEDHFVVLIANANKGVPSRKAFGEQLLAFSIFAQRHDDARLFIHSEQFGAMTGIQFDPLVQACGIADKVKFINQYQMRMGIPPEALAVLYSAADVMLNPTMGEGFGITQLEAQACGLRVITQDFSAQAELAGPGSIKVSGQPFWDATQHAWFSTPSVPHMVDALEEMYAQGRVRSPEAAAWARENYDADAVYARHWRPILDHLAEEIGEEGPWPSSTGTAA
jgi:glycosyltransferase involved in cell wall biosynthesis